MCSCRNFDGNNSNLYFGGNEEEYDNFLTKKMREKRALRKQYREEGYTRKEARQMAREDVNNPNMEEVEETSTSNQIMIKKPLFKPKKLAENIKASMDNAKRSSMEVVDEVETDMKDVEAESKSFFEKNKTMIIVGAVAVGGFFVLRKFMNK